MKEVGRSMHSGDVVKKKTSSGCLIIKKKLVDGVGGGKGFSDSTSRNLLNSTKLKKRPRVIRSDSESSDEFDRRKIDKLHDGPIFSDRSFMENREFETGERVNNRLEFDEHARFQERIIRKDVNDQNHGLKLHRRSGDQPESGSGSSRRINDESHLPIRLQGKNGVLKVMVNKHKQIGILHQTYNPVEAEVRKESMPAVLKKKLLNVSHKTHDHWEGVDRQGSIANQKRIAMESSLYSALKQSEKPVASKIKEKGEMESTKVTKPMFARNIKETDDSDVLLPFNKSSSVRKSSTEKAVKSERSINPLTKNAAPVKGKESKVTRGSGTEKQLLREKIRSMLLRAGWTIDYRPRRNRDYLDSVYINPAGTAYWSIVKAYEALQKEEKDHSQVGGEFALLPVETLSKLTRQTKKKIEREMKNRKDEGNSVNANRARMEVFAEGAKRKEKRRLEDSGDDSNDSKSMETGRDAKRALSFNSHMVQGQKSQKLGRCSLLVHGEGENSENDGFVPYSGKRTLLSWLIDSGTVRMGEKVQYMNRKKTRVMRKGWIERDGIRCGCCSKLLEILKFELHAGSKLCQPFLNIFVESGESLMQCQIDAWNKQGEFEQKDLHSVDIDGDDANDDTCGVCAGGGGGKLICCDGCPSTFHHSCLGIQIYGHLQKLIGVKHDLDFGFSWSLIHRYDLSPYTTPAELSHMVECNSKLAVALSIINECFLPIIDRRSAINVIHNVVYNCGSNFRRLNYGGFFTAILERGDEMISAASIRFHGTQLAEMPFIGTRQIYRRQGMCRMLLSAIESALSFLHIKKLIIPAIDEQIHTWTDVFGFKPLEESHKQETRTMNMLAFPGKDMLQKPLQSTPAGNRISEKGLILAEKSESSCDIKGFGEKFSSSHSSSQNQSVSSDDGSSANSVEEDNSLPVLEKNLETIQTQKELS